MVAGNEARPDARWQHASDDVLAQGASQSVQSFGWPCTAASLSACGNTQDPSCRLLMMGACGRKKSCQETDGRKAVGKKESKKEGKKGRKEGRKQGRKDQRKKEGKSISCCLTLATQ